MEGDRRLSRLSGYILAAVTLAAVAGCTPDYSPNTYSAAAVQQANKVETGIVVGFRQVAISANGTVGAVSGGAAGGILGAQADATGLTQALGTVGGTVVGGLVGSAVEHAAGDTTGWEYIIRKPDGSLLSVTQKEPTPIAIGQKVLVITGNQARVVPDYSTAVDAPAADGSKDKPAAKPDAAAPSPPAKATDATAGDADRVPVAPAPTTPAIPAESLVQPLPGGAEGTDRPGDAPVP